MGGQACVFYGAAEFSRDLDLLILADPENLGHLRAALVDLQAEPIAIPQLDPAHLAKGHAVHFRCRRSDVAGLGIDLMSTYRGGPDFQSLWGRRTTIEIAGEPVDLLALEDLVDAKKTQRHNDWPIIARLMERSYFTRNDRAPQALIEFWFRELRTPEVLIDLATSYPDIARHSNPFDPPSARRSIGISKNSRRRSRRKNAKNGAKIVNTGAR
jgi:hypothetical protein